MTTINLLGLINIVAVMLALTIIVWWDEWQ